MDKNELIENLKLICTESEKKDFFSGVELDFVIVGEKLNEFAKLLYNEKFSLLFISAVHMEPEMAVIYQFVHLEEKIRIRGKVFTDKEKTVETISDIFTGACWYEREIMEFFGIDFNGNTDKRPLILSDSDKGLYPLLKKEGKAKSREDIGL
ncbi:MAG: hypothetical protein CSB21_02555 [Deltaproteobacteria bacterium]|nr:MAG: hypothetical protein CSB21_02555 [Deltaproteobacteria bacterium]